MVSDACGPTQIIIQTRFQKVNTCSSVPQITFVCIDNSIFVPELSFSLDCLAITSIIIGEVKLIFDCVGVDSR